MPELPDITAYITALEARILGQRLERVRLQSVFVLRTADPPLASVEGRTVRALRRIGKRIAIGVDSDLHATLDTGALAVIHLMIARPSPLASAASKARWPPGAPRPSIFRMELLVLTEAGSKRRASLHLLRGEAGPPRH